MHIEANCPDEGASAEKGGDERGSNVLKPSSASTRNSHGQPVLLPNNDLHATFDTGNIEAKSGEMKSMPLEVTSMTEVMLPQLCPAAPPYINSKCHTAVE